LEKKWMPRQQGRASTGSRKFPMGEVSGIRAKLRFKRFATLPSPAGAAMNVGYARPTKSSIVLVIEYDHHRRRRLPIRQRVEDDDIFRCARKSSQDLS
jgi:hypothetical protein